MLPDALLLGVGAVLLAYTVMTVFAARKTRDPSLVVVLVLTAYWTLFGALNILIQKRITGGFATTYMEDKLFLIVPDGAYALTLLSYAIFMLVVIWAAVFLTRDPRTDPTAESSFVALAGRFSHVVLVSIVALATVPKLWIVKRLVDTNDATSLYMATRTVGGENAGYLRIYQYLNIITSYSLVCGFVIWASFKVTRVRYRPAAQGFLWLAYAALAAEVVGENGLLGNRAVPMLVMAAGAVGWLRWRFLPAPRSEKSPLARNFGILGLLGVFVIGVIGNSRGGGGSNPALVLQSMLNNASMVGNVFEQIGNSNEKLASHMALYGIIRERILEVQPLVANSYAAYADLMNAPSDQVFTIHYVAAWWLRLGPLGLPVAAATFAAVLVLLQRFSLSASGSLRGAFVIPAAILPAAGLPITVLRSGPESLRSVLIELILLPGAICLLALLAGERANRAVSVLEPITPISRSISTTGETLMTGSGTTDLTRALDAVKRRWWVPVAAGVLGLALGFASTTGGGVSTYQAVVATPPIRNVDVIGAVSSNATVPVDQLTRQIAAPETATRLGDAVKGSAVTASAATDNASITLRVTAPTAERAKVAAQAYGTDLAAQYDASVKAPLKMALEALDRNIAASKATIAAQPNANNANLASEIAAEQLRHTQIEALVARPAPRPLVTELSSGNPSTSAAVLLGIALAALAAAAVGLWGLFDRRLRYPDDIERVTGPRTVVASLAADRGWGVANVVHRLAEAGPVTVVPVGQAPADALVKAVKAAGADMGPAFGEPGTTPTFAGPVLLLVQLGADRRADLDSAYRALSAADGPFAGVVTAER